MKSVKYKFGVKLLVLICVVMSLLAIAPKNRVLAADPDEDDVFGSVLLTPITKLLTGLGDGIMDVLHSNILEQGETIIKLDGDAQTWWQQHGASVIGILLGLAIGITFAVVTFGAGSAIISGMAAGIGAKLTGVSFIIKTVLTSTALVAGTSIGITGVARFIDSAYLSNDIYVPVFNLTPEEIFANKIWAFDINFFNPNKYTKDFKIQNTIDTPISEEKAKEIGKEIDNAIEWVGNGVGSYSDIIKSENINNFNEIIKVLNSEIKKYEGAEITETSKHKIDIKTSLVKASPITSSGYAEAYSESTYEAIINISQKTDKYTNTFSITVEYVKRHKRDDEAVNNTVVRAEVKGIAQDNLQTGVTTDSTAQQLKDVVSEWYYILRNIAIIVTLLLLIYSGIRIVAGSTAGEKAKYKERIIDWVVSICLIFFMQYIMVFSIEINEKFVELVDSTNGLKGVIKIIQLNTENHINVVKEHELLKDYLITDKDGVPPYGEEELSGMNFLEWPTNIAGGLRIEQQLINEGTANWIGYSLCYLVVVAYTVFFIWTYLRRVLYMAFLTMIAPLVAMTYSLDKITDGKAQAFNSWIREYLFNLLIQPFHLILYTVLVSSAYELAGENALYALVAIGFMMPAEKLLRKFFGFEKAQTPGALGGAAGAALAMSGLQRIISFGNKDVSPEEEDSKDNNEIKYSNADAISPKGFFEDQIRDKYNDAQGENPGIAGGGRTLNVDIPGGGLFNANKPLSLEQDEIVVSGSKPRAPVGTVGDDGKIGLPPKITTVSPSGSSASALYSAGNPGTTSVKPGKKYTIGTSDVGVAKNDNGNSNPGLRRAAISGVSTYFRLQGQKQYKRMQKQRPIRSLLRGGAGLATGTFWGMAGLALAIASGDPSKLLQYTSAGAVGGWGIGKGVGGRVANAFSVDRNKVIEESKMAYYGENYKKAKLEEQKILFAKDENNISYLQKTLGVSRSDAIDILETTGATCLDSGIDNVEDVATMHLFNQEQAIINRIEMENIKLEKYVLEEVELEWENMELTADEKKKLEEELNEEFKKEEEELEKAEAVEDVRRQKELADEQKRREDEQNKLDEQLKREAEQKAKEKLSQMTTKEKQQLENEIKKATFDETQTIQENITRLNQDILKYGENTDEGRRAISELAKANADAMSIAIGVRERVQNEKKKELIEEYINGKDGKSGRKAVLQAKLERDANEREKKSKERYEEERKKSQEKKEELRLRKEDRNDQKEELLRKQKVREEYIQSDDFQRKREEAIKDAQQSIINKDENYMLAYEESQKEGIAFMKYGKRTSDLSKAGAKKIEAYRKQFSNEHYETFYKEYYETFYAEEVARLNDKVKNGNLKLSDEKIKEQAKQKTEERIRSISDELSNREIRGITRVHDTKGKLTEAKDIK